MSLAATITRLREAADAGDLELVRGILVDLEAELVTRRRKQTLRCDECSFRTPWPGALEAHREREHSWRAVA